MSNDDASLHRGSLFSDNPDESESLLNKRFAEGMINLYPHLRSVSNGSKGGETGQHTPPLDANDAYGERLGSSDQAARAQRPQVTTPGREAVSQREIPQVIRPHESAECVPGPSNEKSISNSEQEARRASTGSICLPPRTPGPSTNANVGPRAPLSSVSRESQRSRRTERRKRPELLVRTFYSEVYMRKKNKPAESTTKHMCDYCHTVVGYSSSSLLQRTGNCHKTEIVNKRNALDQSRAKGKPTVSLDSSHGSQREKEDIKKAADRSLQVQNALENEQSISPLSSERRGKKRKLSDTSKTRISRAKTLRASDCESINMSFIKVVVAHNLPLSICDRKNRYQSEFMEFMEEACPAYYKSGIPTSKALRDNYLNKLYENTREKVVKNINRSLGGLRAFGTLMFDGWEDVNGNAVVNVMMRISSSLLSQNSTYLLDSVYTKEKKANAEKYVEVIEHVVQKLNPKLSYPFRATSGTVSDSAKNCVKAKRLLAEKYAGRVSIQDQAHATDILLSDCGKLPWIRELLAKVSTVGQATKNNRKLQSRYKDLIDEHNQKVKRNDVEDGWDDVDPVELDEMSEGLTQSQSPTADQRQQVGNVSELGLDTSRQVADVVRQDTAYSRGEVTGPAIEPVRPTAVTLKKPAKTRFACCETMLEAFVRSRAVLKVLVSDPLFSELYDGSNVANSEKRKEFVDIVNDDDLHKGVREVHNVFRLIRRYLRIWDAEGCQVSEVAPATILLEHNWRTLGTGDFITQERKNDLLYLLERRCSGEVVQDGRTMWYPRCASCRTSRHQGSEFGKVCPDGMAKEKEG